MRSLLAALTLGNVVGALVAPREPRRRGRSALALALGACGVVGPHFLPDAWQLPKTVVAFGTTAGFFRLIEILRHPATTLGARLVSVVYPVVSVRRLEARPRELRAAELVVGALFSVFAVALFVVAGTFAPVPPYGDLPSAMRTIVGGASLYFLVDGTARLSEALFAALGFDLGPLHDAPILATSVGEFWGRRWNRSVHGWLDENAFRPAMRFVLRRGRERASLALAAGVVAAFAASAVLHGLPMLVAYPAPWAAAAMAGFFLLHGAIVVVEAELGVRRWPAPWGRIWTLSLFALTAPLFVEPLLRALGE